MKAIEIFKKLQKIITFHEQYTFKARVMHKRGLYTISHIFAPHNFFGTSKFIKENDLLIVEFRKLLELHFISN
jgi:hypothetical protein